MKVFVVHNRYSNRVPSGENMVVVEECAQLVAAGHEVLTWFRSNDDLLNRGVVSLMASAGRAVHSPRDVVGVDQMIEAHRPDVMHVHNTLPLLSPSVIRPAAKREIPVVHTVHNYRLACASGTLFRDGRPCADCRGRRVRWPAAVHGCYGGSRVASAVAATSISAHRSTWDQIDRFLAISQQVAEFLVEEGVPRDRITVKPNSVADPGITTAAGTGWLFVGRLEAEKGVQLLLDAWRLLPHDPVRTLTIAGDGPLRPMVAEAARLLPTVSYVGQQTQAELAELFRSSAGTIVPSTWAEGFGRVAVESFSHGRPVIATRMGALATIVDHTVGWTCDTVPRSLAHTIVSAGAESAHAKGVAARERYLKRYTPAAVLDHLVNTYREVIEAGHLPRHRR